MRILITGLVYSLLPLSLIAHARAAEILYLKCDLRYAVTCVRGDCSAFDFDKQTFTFKIDLESDTAAATNGAGSELEWELTASDEKLDLYGSLAAKDFVSFLYKFDINRSTGVVDGFGAKEVNSMGKLRMKITGRCNRFEPPKKKRLF